MKKYTSKMTSPQRAAITAARKGRRRTTIEVPSYSYRRIQGNISGRPRVLEILQRMERDAFTVASVMERENLKSSKADKRYAAQIADMLDGAF